MGSQGSGRVCIPSGGSWGESVSFLFPASRRHSAFPGSWPLPPLSRPEKPGVKVECLHCIPLTSSYASSSTSKEPCDSIGPPGESRAISPSQGLQMSNPFARKITCSQGSVIRIWPSCGRGIFLSTTIFCYM